MTAEEWDETPPGADDWDPDAEPMSGVEVLDQVREFLCRFVAFPTVHAEVAVTLWAAHTHAHEVFDSTPRLALLSPEPGSGKSRTLETLELLCPSPMQALSASPAAIFRTIDDAPPTLLLDEVDAIFGRYGKDTDNEDLRALLNAGHRNGAQIPRCVGPTHQVKLFQVYCPVALAGLGDLPDTLMSRSVVIRMRRRRSDEKVEPFRYRDASSTGHVLRDRLAEWVATVADQAGNARPELPVEDRPADVWEPLVALADRAGGTWPEVARSACSALAGEGQTREASLGIRLLTDLRDIFGDTDKLSTTTVLDALNDLDEAPWGDLHGKALDSRGLARRLRQYGIGSTKVKIGDISVRGYRREDLWDTWQRYCPETPPTESGTNGTNGTAQVTDPSSGSAHRHGSGTAQTSGTEPDPSDLHGSTSSTSSAYPNLDPDRYPEWTEERP